jgi:hypothetical protein
MTTVRLRTPAPITVHTTGILPTDTIAQIDERLGHIIGKWTEHSRVRVTRLCQAGVVRPVVIQLNLDLPHGRLRAQVAAQTMRDAVLMLEVRTEAQTRQLPPTFSTKPSRPVLTPPATWSPELRPPELRRLARNKTCTLAPATADEAIRALERMDYEFHFFREETTDQASLVCRTGPGSFRLIQLEPDSQVRDSSRPLVVDRTPVARRTVGEALSRLDLTGRPFEFFADKTTGRGRVVYARYDGHYAMLSAVVPVWSPG